MAASRNSPPAETGLPGVLRARLERELPSGATLCVAFSGGRDSVVLLDILSRLLPPARLLACHVHHGLSLHADDWAAFCQDFAAQRGVPCTVCRVTVARDTGEGVEAAARKARHAALANQPADVVVFAHHQQDQAETVLLKLLRGTGVTGLAGMPFRRLLDHAQPDGPVLWRPLLDVPPALLADHARRFALDWVEDDSNMDTRHARNFLRHEVFPVVRERFPAADAVLARMAEQAAEAQVLLDERAAEDIARLGGDTLNLAGWRQLSAERQRNVLRYWLKQAGWPVPERRTLLAWQAQLREIEGDAQPDLRYSTGSCRVWRGQIHRVPRAAPVPAARAWQGENCLIWGAGQVCFEPYREADVPGLCISARQLAAARASGLAIRLQPRQGGETIRLALNRPQRPLRKYFQECDVPPWARRELPLLWVGEELVACPGVGVSAAWLPDDASDSLLMRWEMSWRHEHETA